jgi:hypothetical protein
MADRNPLGSGVNLMRSEVSATRSSSSGAPMADWFRIMIALIALVPTRPRTLPRMAGQHSALPDLDGGELTGRIGVRARLPAKVF